MNSKNDKAPNKKKVEAVVLNEEVKDDAVLSDEKTDLNAKKNKGSKGGKGSKSKSKNKTQKQVKHPHLKKIFSYFKDLKTELKRVVWPTKGRILRNTIVVLTTVLVIAVLVVLCDLAFQNLLKLLFGKF